MDGPSHDTSSPQEEPIPARPWPYDPEHPELEAMPSPHDEGSLEEPGYGHGV